MPHHWCLRRCAECRECPRASFHCNAHPLCQFRRKLCKASMPGGPCQVLPSYKTRRSLAENCWVSPHPAEVGSCRGERSAAAGSMVWGHGDLTASESAAAALTALRGDGMNERCARSKFGLYTKSKMRGRFFYLLLQARTRSSLQPLLVFLYDEMYLCTRPGML